MAIQLTSALEQRLLTIVNNGNFPSAETALEAAVSALEDASRFEGDPGELESLLSAGMSTAELSEEEFWDSVDRQTDQIAAAHNVGAQR